jgi:hypothetical protein
MIFIASGSPNHPLYLAAILPLKKGSYKCGISSGGIRYYIINSNFYLILVGGEYHKYFIVIRIFYTIGDNVIDSQF